MSELKECFAVLRENDDEEAMGTALETIRNDLTKSHRGEDRSRDIRALSEALSLQKDSSGELMGDDDLLHEVAATYLEISKKWPQNFSEKMVCDLVDIAVFAGSPSIQIPAENALINVREKDSNLSTTTVRSLLLSIVENYETSDAYISSRALDVWNLLHPALTITRPSLPMIDPLTDIPDDVNVIRKNVSPQAPTSRQALTDESDTVLRDVFSKMPFHSEARGKIFAEAALQEAGSFVVQSFLQREMPLVLKNVRNFMLSDEEQTKNARIYKAMMEHSKAPPSEKDCDTLVFIAKNFKNEAGAIAFEAVHMLYDKWAGSVSTTNAQMVASLALNQDVRKDMRVAASDLLFWSKSRMNPSVVANVAESVATTRMKNKKTNVRKAAQELLVRLDPIKAVRVNNAYDRLKHAKKMQQG